MADERSHRTKFRHALQTALAKHFKDAGLEIAFEPGRLEGPSTDRDIGCVWFDSKRPHGRDGNNEEAFFGVRVLRHLVQDQGAGVTREEIELALEWTFETLEDALAGVLTRPWLEDKGDEVLSGWGDFIIVTNIATDHAAQHVTASIVAQARNRTARGG